MSRTIPFLMLVLITFPYVSTAADWEQITSGTVDGSVFNVFIDTESIEIKEDGTREFWQGHVFVKNQPLPSGKTYSRVSIRGIVDCAKKTISNAGATFYSKEGTVVDSYNPVKAEVKEEQVKPDTISEATLKFVCKFEKEQDTPE